MTAAFDFLLEGGPAPEMAAGAAPGEKAFAQIIHQDSGENDWWTPVDIILAASELMGGIDLDPASSPEANNRQPGGLAARIYTAEEDGRRFPWLGNIWMNHPFSRAGNPSWIGKLIRSSSLPGFVQSCNICFASVGAEWFAPLLRYPQFIFTGRVEYVDPTSGRAANGVLKDSILTYIPPKGVSYARAVRRLRHAYRDFDGWAK